MVALIHSFLRGEFDQLIISRLKEKHFSQSNNSRLLTTKQIRLCASTGLVQNFKIPFNMTYQSSFYLDSISEVSGEKNEYIFKRNLMLSVHSGPVTDKLFFESPLFLTCSQNFYLKKITMTDSCTTFDNWVHHKAIWFLEYQATKQWLQWYTWNM